MSESILFNTGKENVKYPQKLNILESATDHTYLHIEVEQKGMREMYLSLHKRDYQPEMQLRVNSVAKEDNRITFEFNSLDNVNGEYEMTLVGTAGPAGQTIRWDLGTVKAWFREGQ